MTVPTAGTGWSPDHTQSIVNLDVRAGNQLWTAVRQDKVPAFVVLSDKHLRGIADAHPRTLTDLRALPGIGPTKLDLYGEEILAVLHPDGPVM